MNSDDTTEIIIRLNPKLEATLHPVKAVVKPHQTKIRWTVERPSYVVPVILDVTLFRTKADKDHDCNPVEKLKFLDLPGRRVDESSAFEIDVNQDQRSRHDKHRFFYGITSIATGGGKIRFLDIDPQLEVEPRTNGTEEHGPDER